LLHFGEIAGPSWIRLSILPSQRAKQGVAGSNEVNYRAHLARCLEDLRIHSLEKLPLRVYSVSSTPIAGLESKPSAGTLAMYIACEEKRDQRQVVHAEISLQ
jgi:hypothetical protein